MQQMLRKGWRPAGPAAPDAVVAIEREFDVSLPEDFREFLVQAGGGEATAPDSFTALWSARMCVSLNRRLRIPWNFPGLLGIGNDGFLVYALDFRAREPAVASLGFSSSDWRDVVTESDSFAEWLERRLP